MKSPRPAAPSSHARQAFPSGAPDLLAGRPSVYTQAQGPAQVKGLTLHPEDTLEQLRSIQRRIGETAARDKVTQAQARARRLRGLSAVSALLWLAMLVVVLAYL